MFPKAYFGRRYFPARYWPVVVVAPVIAGTPEAVFPGPVRVDAGQAPHRKAVYQGLPGESTYRTNRFDTIYSPAPRSAAFLVEE